MKRVEVAIEVHCHDFPSLKIKTFSTRSTLLQPKNSPLRWKQWGTTTGSKRSFPTQNPTFFPFLKSGGFEPYLSSPKVAGVVFTVGGLASGAKGLMDVVKGATPGQVWFSAKQKIFTSTLCRPSLRDLKLWAQSLGRMWTRKLQSWLLRFLSGFDQILPQTDFGSNRVRERFCRGLLLQCLEGSPCCGICTRLDRVNLLLTL